MPHPIKISSYQKVLQQRHHSHLQPQRRQLALAPQVQPPLGPAPRSKLPLHQRQHRRRRVRVPELPADLLQRVQPAPHKKQLHGGVYHDMEANQGGLVPEQDPLQAEKLPVPPAVVPPTPESVRGARDLVEHQGKHGLSYGDRPVLAEVRHLLPLALVDCTVLLFVTRLGEAAAPAQRKRGFVARHLLKPRRHRDERHLFASVSHRNHRALRPRRPEARNHRRLAAEPRGDLPPARRGHRRPPTPAAEHLLWGVGHLRAEVAAHPVGRVHPQALGKPGPHHRGEADAQAQGAAILRFLVDLLAHALHKPSVDIRNLYHVNFNVGRHCENIKLVMHSNPKKTEQLHERLPRLPLVHHQTQQSGAQLEPGAEFPHPHQLTTVVHLVQLRVPELQQPAVATLRELRRVAGQLQEPVTHVHQRAVRLRGVGHNAGLAAGGVREGCFEGRVSYVVHQPQLSSHSLVLHNSWPSPNVLEALDPLPPGAGNI
mmetsp:Transcript_113137/g.259301  ORF Transcript_113137/g.259301 Transcript_113137/m.259301 type:complete len:485 (-) Transcript_113137:178-1632(-)